MSFCRYAFLVFAFFAGLNRSLWAEQPVLALGAPHPIQLVSRSVQSDGMKSNFYHLSSNDFEVNWYLSNQNWRRLQTAPIPSSLSFQDARLPDLKMHLFLYSAHPEMQVLSEVTLSRYLGLLRQKMEPDMIAVLNPGDFRPLVGSLPFIDGDYRVLQMELVPEDANQPILHITEFLRIMESGMIFVVRFQGPVDVMERMESSMHGTLSEFVSIP